MAVIWPVDMVPAILSSAMTDHLRGKRFGYGTHGCTSLTHRTHHRTHFFLSDNRQKDPSPLLQIQSNPKYKSTLPENSLSIIHLRNVFLLIPVIAAAAPAPALIFKNDGECIPTRISAREISIHCLNDKQP